MKILYYSPHPSLALNSMSGYGTHMREMIAGFEAVGCSVTTVIMGGINEDYQSDKNPTASREIVNYTKKLVPNCVWESLKDARLLKADREFEANLIDILKKEKPDFIYERGNYLQLSGVRAAKSLGIPHIMEVNSPYVETKRKSLKGPFFYKKKAQEIEKAQLTDTSGAFYVSKTLRNHFVEKYDLPEARHDTALMAIDPKKVSHNEQSLKEIREKYNLNDSIVLGYAGAIFPWHGTEIMVQALKTLLSEYPSLKLLIVGDGSARPELINLTAELNLENKVIFTGRVPHSEVFNFINAMDITILPDSHWYGTPTKLFEYAAMSKPVIACDVPPVREIMDNQKDGLVISPTVSALSEAIRTYLNNPEQMKKMAQSFKARVLEQHTWEQNVNKVMSYVNQL